MWHTIVRHRITSKGQNHLADRMLWCIWGEACQHAEGEACSAQGEPTSWQWLPVCHVWSDVPVKDRTLRSYQNTSLVKRSLALTAQSRRCAQLRWICNRPYTRGDRRRNCRSDCHADWLPVVYTRGNCHGDGLQRRSPHPRSFVNQK